MKLLLTARCGIAKQIPRVSWAYLGLLHFLVRVVLFVCFFSLKKRSACGGTLETQTRCKEKAKRKVWLTGVEIIKSRGRNKASEKQSRGDGPGIHRVIKESEFALRWSAAWRTGAQSGRLLDRLTDWLADLLLVCLCLCRSRALAGVKKSLNFKAGPTATTTLTPLRRDQIVENRDPISNPCDRK